MLEGRREIRVREGRCHGRGEEERCEGEGKGHGGEKMGEIRWREGHDN